MGAKAKVPLTDEQLAIREANKKKAAIYKERRITLGLSQKQLAKKAGVAIATISNMETGRYQPTWETCQKIRRVLGMPEEQIYSVEQLAVWEKKKTKMETRKVSRDNEIKKTRFIKVERRIFKSWIS